MLKEGRLSAGNCGYNAYYYLKDHLGSIRAVIDSVGNVCERNDYYPFGLEHQRGDYPQLVENREKKVSDHAHTIKNMFVHENQHYEDYKRMGKKAYLLSSETYREVRAIRAQRNDETFKYMGNKYKQSLLQYEIDKLGIPLGPVPEIPMLPLFNPYK